MIVHAINNCLRNARTKGWEKTYWAFDVHGTILKPTFQKGVPSSEYYPFAKEALQLVTLRKDITTILFTCSHPHEIVTYIDFFRQDGIVFDYVNENPETLSGAYGNYSQKFYFNILFEDKAGFDPFTEWEMVYSFMNAQRYTWKDPDLSSNHN